MAIAMVHDDYQRIVGIYDEKLRQKRLWEQKISAQLPAALSERQIFPYLQPQYNSENELTGAEVLVRWQHPEEGFLAPYRFIPILEKNGMIVRVDAFIWEEACRILSAWRGTPKERLHLSVNISPKDFYFIDIYETFTGLVEKYGLAPGSLHLEITETVVMNDAAENIRTINRLREYGFIVEMDDFGSGYSSLNLLRDMPVDVLKIDMAFLGRTTHPKKAELILNNVIELAHRLNMISIAEGIELKNQLDMLKQMGCNVFQGYYFAKPMPLGDFEKLAA
jgi:EAL domain-containing protein (putative c-di-GMP-specific phosphodiesterase class I)